MPAPIREIGRMIDGKTGEFIPLFSLQSIRLARANNWNVSSGVQAALLTTWRGSEPVYYDIDFELVVGWSSIKTRQHLYDKIRVFHAMASHRMSANGKLTLPPPPVRLILSSYINMVGVLSSIETDAGPPWGKLTAEGGGTALMPTKCRFSGKFMFMPGYDGSTGSILVTGNNDALSHTKVRNKLYFNG